MDARATDELRSCHLRTMDRRLAPLGLFGITVLRARSKVATGDDLGHVFNRPLEPSSKINLLEVSTLKPKKPRA